MCDKIYTILARKKASNKIKYIFVVLNYFCIRAHALIIGVKKNYIFIWFINKIVYICIINQLKQ